MESKLKNLFKNVHKDYCLRFNKFMKNFDKTFQKNSINENEFKEIMEWISEYQHMIKCVEDTLDDFEYQVRKETLQLTPLTQLHRNIGEEVESAIMPLALVYWMYLYNQQSVEIVD